VPIDIEIWDTPYGQEKHCELMFYSQSYIQGKHGIILCVNSEDFTNSENNINERNF